MTTSDKTLLGILVLSLTVGLVQHSYTKGKKAQRLLNTESVRSATSAEGTNPPSSDATMEWSGGNLTPYVEYTHIVDSEPQTDTSKSKNQQRMEAIREKHLNLGSQNPVQLDEGFDYFSAREGMKEMLFSSSFNGGSNTLSEAEKWAIIESGDLPW